MREYHRGKDQRGHRARPGPSLEPGQEREGEEREQAPAQPRGHEAPAQPLLRAAARARGDDEREERGREGRPPGAERAREQRIGGRGGEEKHQPHQDQVKDAGGREPEGRPMERVAQIEEERRIVLELGIAGPPARVPVPRRRPERDHVDQAIELAWMIVHARDTAAERRPTPCDGVDCERNCRDHPRTLHARARVYRASLVDIRFSRVLSIRNRVARIGDPGSGHAGIVQVLSGLKSPTDGEAMDRVKGLTCRECGRSYPSSPAHVCEFCFGPLEVDYDYGVVRARVSRARIEAGPRSIWRYADLLPVELDPDGEPPVGQAAGFTPLVRARNLGEELGVTQLYIKNDSVCHPTWSFKDRVVSVAVAKAQEFGFDTVACASTGNLANSVAAHAAEAHLKAYVFIPTDLEQGKVTA